ncbi:hypothetical protein H9Q09_00695 [Aurantimonas sp. DM33-3]|uniref:DUF6074 family protein n=1 Tax=Aurantimonas sp. DM33-3 TaxID=2766955 RepID=UPI001652A655|nr:DUF6074 family protein [Aurantimonas sp. DM33-3]MBC6714703.1 hypothetical protein [Aurantimonas sp. DM33-3]
MDRHSDLPLFRWEPPKAEIIPFPLASRVGRIRDVVDRFSGKTRAQQEAYWRQVRDGQLRSLRRLGLPEQIVIDEWRKFFDAVQTELTRRAYVGRQSRPGGDAA